MSRCRHIREQLWLAVRLNLFPLDVLGAGASSAPVVVQEKRRTEVVVCANHSAVEAGVSPGLDCTTAQLLSDCEVLQRDRHLERQKLIALADSLYRFSPYIETTECEPIAQAGIQLEVSSCLSLFGGLIPLTDQIRQLLSTTGYNFAFGVGHSAQAAWLLSWTNQAWTGSETRNDFLEQLRPLPLTLIHEHADAVSMLEKMGFVILGDVANQIQGRTITGLKKRLSREFIDYVCDVFGIDQAMQQKSLFQKPVTQHHPKEMYRDEMEFEYPVARSSLLHTPIEIVLQSLSHYLSKRQHECQQIVWTLSDIHRRTERFVVRCDSGQSDWRLFYDLTLIQLENRELTFEVDRLVLECPETSRIQDRRQTLNFSNQRAKTQNQQDLEIALAKLRAGLGDQCVYKLSYRDNHVPEAMAEAIPVNERSNQDLPSALATAVRPIWLFAQPYKAEKRERGVYWRGYFELLVGPERIHDNWWETPRARDYYLAQRDDFARFWVFQDIYDGSWYVHGEFA